MTAPASRTFAIAAELRRFVIDAGTGDAVGTKAPGEVLDYAFDWTAFLTAASNPADTIESFELFVASRDPLDEDPDTEQDLEVFDDDQDGAVITFWLRHGFAGSAIAVTCEVVTAGGRTARRSIHFGIVEG